MKNSKKTIVTVFFVFLIATIAIAFSCVSTYAIWTQVTEASVIFEVGTRNENPSLKYQIFVPINNSNQRVPGTFDVTSRSYTLTNSSDASTVTGLALVGWDGGIAVSRLEIPDTFTYNINGADIVLPVRIVAVFADFRQFYFRGNTIITSIIFPQNVVFIGSGVFASMENLTAVTYYGTGEVRVKNDAFIDCRNLSDPFRPNLREIVWID